MLAVYPHTSQVSRVAHTRFFFGGSKSLRKKEQHMMVLTWKICSGTSLSALTSHMHSLSPPRLRIRSCYEIRFTCFFATMWYRLHKSLFRAHNTTLHCASGTSPTLSREAFKRLQTAVKFLHLGIAMLCVQSTQLLFLAAHACQHQLLQIGQRPTTVQRLLRSVHSNSPNSSLCCFPCLLNQLRV